MLNFELDPDYAELLLDFLDDVLEEHHDPDLDKIRTQLRKQADEQ